MALFRSRPKRVPSSARFARACKASRARCAALYPAAHPAIATTLARLVDSDVGRQRFVGSQDHRAPDLLAARGPLTRPRRRGRGRTGGPPARAPGRELTIHPGGDSRAPRRSFLLLLARTPDSVRADGGIARLWMTTGAQHVELREIDYAEVLRERREGREAVWERVIVSCLQGRAFDLSPEARRDTRRNRRRPATIRTVGRGARRAGSRQR